LIVTQFLIYRAQQVNFLVINYILCLKLSLFVEQYMFRLMFHVKHHNMWYKNVSRETIFCDENCILF